MFICPNCKKEIRSVKEEDVSDMEEINSYVEDDTADLNDIFQGETVLTHFYSFYCPHCNQDYDFTVKSRIEKIEYKTEIDEEEITGVLYEHR